MQDCVALGLFVDGLKQDCVALGLFVDGLKPNGDMDGGSVYRLVYMFRYSYVLDVDVGSEKRGGYICLYFA